MSRSTKPTQALAKKAANEPAKPSAKPYRTIVAVNGKVTVEETKESVAEFEQAFGSALPDYQVHTLGQVLNVIRAGADLTVPGNAALAMMAAIKPANELEAALAAQMVAAHHFAMLSWSRAATRTGVEVVQANASLANKASRTFTMQMEALAQMRRGGEQVVRHVHVNDGGQAVIAETFNAGKGVGGEQYPAINAMRLAPRCGARTRAGGQCKGPAMLNGRCRLHGGRNPGAPPGNRNAWKHGLRSSEHQAMRRLLRAFEADLKISESRKHDPR